jgi:aminopeptidase N
MADGTSALAASANNSGLSDVTYLKDYQPPVYLIDSTDLVFDLLADKTLVQSTLALRKNPAVDQSQNTLTLDGDQLELLSIKIDGVVLEASTYQLFDGGLRLESLPDQFVLEITTVIDPAKNLRLEGLYLSDGMNCTQSEAEGFRRISYYQDRPDVMSVFSTKIIADVANYPI